jgi:hypothetical protein
MARTFADAIAPPDRPDDRHGSGGADARAEQISRDRLWQARKPGQDRDYAGVVVPLQLLTKAGLLSFFSTTTIFGTPIDITLSELAIEAFFPANAATAAALRGLAH